MPDWTRFCRTRDFTVEEPDVYVHFPSGRRQRVRVREEGEVFHLTSTVLGRSALARLLDDGGAEAERDLGLRILERNRSAPLVGFRWTHKHKVIAETHVPFIGLSRDEFRLHLLRVAREADWLEMLLTGEDRN